jgi:hypothetical protein
MTGKINLSKPMHHLRGAVSVHAWRRRRRRRNKVVRYVHNAYTY